MGEQVLHNVMFSDGDNRGSAPANPYAQGYGQQQSQFRSPAGVNSDWFGQGGQGSNNLSNSSSNGNGNGNMNPNSNAAYNPNFASAPMTSNGFEGQMSASHNASNSMDDYDNEPPLLEELGVNIEHIVSKTKAVMSPTKAFDTHLMDDTDMAGPVREGFNLRRQ